MLLAPPECPFDYNDEQVPGSLAAHFDFRLAFPFSRSSFACMLPPRPTEALLIATLEQFPPGSLLCHSAGRGQLAIGWAERNPKGQATCHFLDLFPAEQVLATQPPANVHVVCESDLPAGMYEAVAIPCPMRGVAELAREWLQQGCQRLVPGGWLFAATDHPHDRWLHAQLEPLAAKVTRWPSETGVVYAARIDQPPARVRQFEATFAFRDGSRLLTLHSRPGVFSHRELDLGARALIETMQLSPGERVLEIGCGSGGVTIAAAAREPTLQVDALDTNPRAVECTLRSAASNGLTNVAARLGRGPAALVAGTYDVVLTNPPYYSQTHLAQEFLQTACAALRGTGRCYLVTKRPTWFAPLLEERFVSVTSHSRRGYSILEVRLLRQ
jgi:16S rRNA (guanine1207-N2)-methyltransferase